MLLSEVGALALSRQEPPWRSLRLCERWLLQFPKFVPRRLLDYWQRSGKVDSEMSYEIIITLNEKPELEEQVDRLSEEAWPEFLRHANTHHWSSLFSTFADYQLLLYDPEDGLLAVGLTVPLIWDGTRDDLPAEMNTLVDR